MPFLERFTEALYALFRIVFGLMFFSHGAQKVLGWFGGQKMDAPLPLVAGWIEFALLRNSLNRRIGRTGLSISRMAVLWGSAVAGGVVAWGVKLAIPWTDPLVRGALILPAFGATYLACAAALGVDVRRQLLRG